MPPMDKILAETEFASRIFLKSGFFPNGGGIPTGLS